MTSTKRLSLYIVLIAALLITFLLLPQSRKQVPDLSFTDIDGGQHHFADFKGQPLLMIFWATDCPGCIKEMPDLIALHNEYSEKGLAMVSVAMPHDTPQHIQTMRKQKSLPYLITWDKTGEIGQAFDNVRVTPTHFLVSPEGEIVMRKIGALKIEQLKQKLATMGLEANNS